MNLIFKETRLINKRLVISTVVLLLFTSLSVSAKHNDDGDYYERGKKTKTLPPGLQKKYDRGGYDALPPGWQKKLAEGDHLSPEMYRLSRILTPVNERGEQLIRLDDRTMRVIQATGEIVRIFGQ